MPSHWIWQREMLFWHFTLSLRIHALQCATAVPLHTATALRGHSAVELPPNAQHKVLPLNAAFLNAGSWA